MPSRMRMGESAQQVRAPDCIISEMFTGRLACVQVDAHNSEARPGHGALPGGCSGRARQAAEALELRVQPVCAAGAHANLAAHAAQLSNVRACAEPCLHLALLQQDSVVCSTLACNEHARRPFSGSLCLLISLHHLSGFHC